VGKPFIKPVYIGTNDEDILPFLAKIDHFSNWVKAKIREEIKSQDKNEDITSIVERILAAKGFSVGAVVPAPRRPKARERDHADSFL
jgi:hypothetical protein